MASIPMKCHICDQELMPDNYASWHIASRKMVVHRCINTKCLSHTEAFCAVQLDMVLPDNYAESYVLPIKMKDQWYKFYGAYRHSSNGQNYLYCKGEVLLELKRFYPISAQLPLAGQISAITDKLKTLLLFS
jgi:hypothetical protein